MTALLTFEQFEEYINKTKTLQQCVGKFINTQIKELYCTPVIRNMTFQKW